jgi:hypothetical protein
MKRLLIALCAASLVSSCSHTLDQAVQVATGSDTATITAADDKAFTAMAALKVRCWNGVMVQKLKQCPVQPPPPPPPPPTQTCLDGTVILATDTCPVPPPPPPPPPPTQTCGDGAVIPLTQICTVPPTPCPTGTQWDLQTGHCEAIPPPPPPPPPPTQTCPDGTVILATDVCPAPPPPPPVVCPDGSTLPAGSTCPTPPPPTSFSWVAVSMSVADYVRTKSACTTWPEQEPLAAGLIFKRVVPGPNAFPINRWAWGYTGYPDNRYIVAVYNADPVDGSVEPGALGHYVYMDCVEGVVPAP